MISAAAIPKKRTMKRSLVRKDVEAPHHGGVQHPAVRLPGQGSPTPEQSTTPAIRGTENSRRRFRCFATRMGPRW